MLETADDYVGLWSVIREVKNKHPDSDASLFRKQTIKLIRELLDNQLIQAGQFSTIKFEIWNTSSEETINRIEKEWDELGREPDISDIVWFIATEKGESETKKM
ncbi:MAG: hypothetical protein ACRC8K_00460, partial [Waterburya sp.]